MSYIAEEDFSKKIKVKVWKRLLTYAFRHKKLVYSLLACLLVVSAADVVYPLMSKYAIDHFITPQTTEGLTQYALFFVGLVLLDGIGVAFFVSTAGKIEMHISHDIRQDAFTKLQNLSFSYYDKTPVGYIMARVMNDVSRLSEMVAWSIVDIIWSLVFIIGCIIAMFLLNLKLALLALVVIPPLAVVTLFFQKKILAYYRRVRRTNSRLTGAFNEGIMGAMTTKTLVREDQNLHDFKNISSEMRHVSTRAALLSALFMPIILFLSSIGTGLALYAGGLEVMLGAISFGTLSSFLSYTSQLFDPIQQIARILAELQNAQASAERVISLLDMPIEIQDTPAVEAVFGDSIHPKKQNWPTIRGDITFDHVSFAYKSGEKVLKDFNLHVPAGKSVALVGETGAGKSTIVNILCRFYEPTGGRVLIDGVDYRERSQLWLQSNTGYVLQQPHLFSGTVRDNIDFGRRDATDADIRRAAQMVHAEEFILTQKDGYDTQVGEGGIRLSTGQKQLISFARVILADPRIFILDEATSSVDTETEQHIQKAITHVLKDRTSFIIAHRLSTIRSSDIILVIGNGGILEQGTHAELIARRGQYYQLCMKQ